MRPAGISARRGRAILGAAAFALLFFVTIGWAGDYIVELNENNVDLASKGVGPGDTVWLRGGTRQTLVLINVVGSPEQPVLVTNYGGQLVLQNGNSHALQFRYSSNFIIRGTPSPGNYEYGIRILNNRSGSSGLVFEYQTTDFEACDIEIANSGYAGVVAKDDSQKRPGWVMKNVKLHDLYIHDVRGEGMYIGSSFWSQGSHELHNVHIYNNRVINSGLDGIQVGCASENTSVHNNLIVNSGTRREQYHQNGMQIGEGCATHVYNNIIQGGTGDGLFFSGLGNNQIYNNVFIRQPRNALFITGNGHIYDRPFYIMNNTIIQPGNNGCWYWAMRDAGSIFANNLVVGPGQEYFNRYRDDDSHVIEFNNLYVPTLAGAGFVSAATDNFRLQASSPAVDAGATMLGLGVTFDQENNFRPLGLGYDIGAYEYQSTGNSAPVVYAGDDQSTLEGIVFLDAITLDDGVMDPPWLTVSWSQVSGPGNSIIHDPESIDTSVTLSTYGPYTFKLTVDDGEHQRSDEVSITYGRVPKLAYRSVDLGHGLTGWRFFIVNNDGLNLSYLVTLDFEGYGEATLRQMGLNGVISVNTETMAAGVNGLGDPPYSMSLDSWVYSPFGDNPLPGSDPLTGTSFNGFHEAPNRYLLSCWTGANSYYGDGINVAYLVADGHVAWSGRIHRNNVDYATSGVTSPPGDFNEDGTVDLTDYTLWADTYGYDGSPGKSDLRADANGDGVVDLADYSVWADYFGQSR